MIGGDSVFRHVQDLAVAVNSGPVLVEILDSGQGQRVIDEFLEHIRECPDCYDELETYYTINVGTKYLENENMGSYNIPRMLKENLREKEKYIRRKQLLTKTVLFFSLVAGIGIALSFMLYFGHIELPNLF